MLCDWQLSNPTMSLLKNFPTAHQGKVMAPPSLFYFFAGKMLLRRVYCLSCNYQPPPQKILQSPGRLGRPQSRVETSSARSALSAPYVRALRLGIQCNQWAYGCKLYIINYLETCIE